LFIIHFIVNRKRSVRRAVPVVEQSPSLSLIFSSVCEGAGHVTIGVILESDIKNDLHLRLETVADSAKGEDSIIIACIHTSLIA